MTGPTANPHPNTATSEPDPIRVDWTETALWPGRLGLTLAPGRKDLSADGRTRHDRDLLADLTRLRREHHAQTLVSLLEDDEARRHGLQDYDEHADALGLDVLHHPVPGADVPRNPALYAETVDEIMNRLLNGETVVAHGLDGLGRAGTLAACLLVQAGMAPGDAVKHVRQARPGATMTDAQVRYVHTFGE